MNTRKLRFAPVIGRRSRKNATDREAQPTPKRWRASRRGDGAAVKRLSPGSTMRTLIPPPIRRLCAHRANPIGESRLRRSLSGAEVRVVHPLCLTGCPVR
jgi:hypothetical protein